jgi:hypothetical protein
MFTINFIKHLLKSILLLVLILSCLMFISCSSKLKISKIQYDESNGFYNYLFKGEVLPLRNKNGELINKSNFAGFLDSINKSNNVYDIKSLREIDLFISQADEDLVNLYTGLIHSLSLKELSAARFFSNEILRAYPDAGKFTDVNFLEGQMWELFENSDSARFYYFKFLEFSSSKYSKRFRGYIYNDSAEHCFTKERKYALKFLEGQINEPVQSCLINLESRYYFESFSPGFLLNREDFSRHDRFIPVVNFNIPPLKTVYLGIGLITLFDDKYALYGEVNRFKDFTNGQIAFPIEVYKAESNRFGINASPVFYYQVADNVEDNSNQLFVNIGGSISTSYRFNRKLYIGISYLYYVYNNKHKKRAIYFTHNENQFDLSMYYQIIKGMSLKVGMVNDHPVIGLTYVGNLFWYDFKSTSVGLTFNVY